MPMGKKNEDVELDFGSTDERELTGSDANPIDAATGESLFDDLNPRFVRQLDAAVEKVNKKPPKESNDEDEDLDADDADPTDDDDLDADLDADEPSPEPTDDDDLEVTDEDADEPRPGRKPTAIERRIARSNRLIEEVRLQNQELANRLSERESKDKLAASETEFAEFKTETQTKLDALKVKKAKAIDDGDSEAQAAIEDEVIELRTELGIRQREHAAAKDAVEKTKRRGASPIVITKVAQWKRKNPRYDRDPEYAAAVNALDASLAAGGSNPESDEHYAKLDRQLKKLYPPKVKTPQRRHPSQQQAREESPSVRRSAGDARVQIKGKKIKISPAKLQRVKENMTRFGLDPSNKTDLFDYIQNNPGL